VSGDIILGEQIEFGWITVSIFVGINRGMDAQTRVRSLGEDIQDRSKNPDQPDYMKPTLVEVDASILACNLRHVGVVPPESVLLGRCGNFRSLDRISFGVCDENRPIWTDDVCRWHQEAEEQQCRDDFENNALHAASLALTRIFGHVSAATESFERL